MTRKTGRCLDLVSDTNTQDNLEDRDNRERRFGLNRVLENHRWAREALVALVTEQSLPQLFTELRDPLCRYLLSLGLNPAEAEDAAQESFLRLCERLAREGPQNHANIRGWLFRVAHNLARDNYRHSQRRPAEALEDNMEAVGASSDSRPTPEEHLLEREREKRLQAELNRLPEEQRHCLHLRAEGLRYREIAEVLGVGTSTVAEWVQHALKSVGEGMR
jgi:RNA polymerase sigma-70 factor (ECF subfamily)